MRLRSAGAAPPSPSSAFLSAVTTPSTTPSPLRLPLELLALIVEERITTLVDHESTKAAAELCLISNPSSPSRKRRSTAPSASLERKEAGRMCWCGTLQAIDSSQRWSRRPISRARSFASALRRTVLGKLGDCRVHRTDAVSLPQPPHPLGLELLGMAYLAGNHSRARQRPPLPAARSYGQQRCSWQETVVIVRHGASP